MLVSNNTKRNRTLKLSSGFTVAEMIVSIGLFTIVATIATMSLLSVVTVNKKAQTMKAAINNFNFAAESMARNLRMGVNYHCDHEMGIPLTSAKDCPSGGPFVTFLDSNGQMSGYQWDSTLMTINKLGAYNAVSDSFASIIPITASEIVIHKLQFFVDGTNPVNEKQPRILILINGYAKAKDAVDQTKSTFNIETMVSQRLANFGP
ncbi:MAG: type II secretion system protein [Candidatus Paceibacterota bacterium]|jgi:type II secretory pathway pseudopilin PulG